MASYPETTQMLLTLLDSVLTPKSAIYAAGPLDTGRAYYEALVHGAVDASIRANNEEALTAFVGRLRARHHPAPVIDPGPLRVDGWSPRQVGDFFLQTISRYAREAWFIDGWEYSSGATKEYLYCVSHGIPCMSEAGAELKPADAVDLLSIAIQQIARLGVPGPKLLERLAAFKSLLTT